MPKIVKIVFKLGLSILLVIISILIIALFLFSKPLLEQAVRAGGFPSAQIDSVVLSTRGTKIKNLSLDANTSIAEITLYATLKDILNARIGHIIVTGAKINIDVFNGEKDRKAKVLPINLHVNKIDIAQAEILLPTPSGILSLTATGNIVDRGESYQGSLMFEGSADFGKTAGQVTASLQKQSGDTKIHLDISDAKLTLPNLDVKRTSGWIESNFNLNASPVLQNVSAQITTGAIRLYSIPLQGTTLTASSNEGKTQILLQGDAKNGSGSITLDIQGEADKAALSLNAALKNLESLEIAGLKGQGTLNLSLAVEKSSEADWLALDKLRKVDGRLSMSSKKLSIPDVMSGMNASLETEVALDPELKQILLKISGLEFDSPQLSFMGKPSQLKIQTTETPVISGNIELQNISAGENKTSLWVTPVDLSLHLKPVEKSPETTKISGNIKEKNGLIYLLLEGKHDAKLQKGYLNIDMPPISLTKGVTGIGDIFPFIQKRVPESSGTVGLTGKISWLKTSSGWKTGKTEATLLLKQFSAIIDALSLKNVSTVLHLENITPLVFNKQSIFIGALNAGVPLTNGVLQLSLDPAGNLGLHQGQWDLAKGKITAAPFMINLDEMTSDIILTAKGLDLPELFKIAPLEGLDATGRVNGSLPLHIQGAKIMLAGGVFETEGPGSIRYNPREVPAFLQDNSQKQIVDLRVALKAFDFEALRITMDGEIGKNQKISLHAQGKNPEFYGGYPVNINLTVEGPLQSVLKYSPGGSQIPDSIKQQIENFEKQRHADQ